MARPSQGRPSPPFRLASSRYRSHSRCSSDSDSGSSSHSRYRSRSRSPSRSRWRLRSFPSSPPHRSASSGCRSPRPPRKSPADVAKRGTSPTGEVERASPPPRKASPIRESLTLHVDSLSRNVHEGHLKEIFSIYGEVMRVDLAMDRTANRPRGFGYVEFKVRADAENALLYMDGAQIDGQIVRVRFPKTDGPGADVDKDRRKRPRESSPRITPIARRGAYHRHPLPDSPPPCMHLDSPPCFHVASTIRRGETPPRRRPASPGGRDRSSSPPSPRRYLSPPRNSPRRVHGSLVRRRSPLSPRRRSPPRRDRSPATRYPLSRRSRSPFRRPSRSRSRSPSLLRALRGRGSSNRSGRSPHSSESCGS